uniref:Uncharacterized protein n=1 Tax=Kalanchoe fedtschenkoi TaxID=63787 RepID=A0A7N0UJF4_KALFE
MAALSTSPKTVGLSQTFTRLKEQGKVTFIPYITAGDPNLLTTKSPKHVKSKASGKVLSRVGWGKVLIKRVAVGF